MAPDDRFFCFLQLKDYLSTAFEDLSSIDDEDEETSSEFRSSEFRQPQRGLLHGKKFVSTPNDNNNGIRGRPHHNISVIEEEPNSIHSTDDDVKGSDEVTSVERGREADQHNESYHIRLLLDQNKKLCDERTKLQQLCDNVTGDFEGVSYKCQRLEEVLSEKEKLVEQLMGKLAALQISMKSAKEVQSETSNKLVIAENTISSLRNELKEMHQADGMERIRVLYESQLQQLKEKYETERSGWIDDREQLKEKLDEQKHQISKLRIELDLRLKKAASDRRLSSGSDTALTKKLEAELETVREANRLLELKAAQNEASLQQVQSQLSLAKQSLTEKEHESQKLGHELQFKIHELEAQKSEVHRLNDEIKSMADSLKQVESRLSENRVRSEMSERSMTSKMNQEIISQVKEYREQIQQRYQSEFESRVKEVKDAYSRQQEQIETCVTRICSWIEGLTGQGLKPQECELYSVFEPIVKIWSAIEKKMDEQLGKMVEKRKEIEEAKRELEEAYMDSKSEGHDANQPLLDTMHVELREAKEEITALKEKLTKYKKNYTMHVKKVAAEREQLKHDYAALIRRQVTEVCKDREEQLTDLLSRDSRQLLQQINQAYLESLRHLKEQNDRFFEESNGKSLQKMADAIVTYHEIVTRKITQRNNQLTWQVNQTLCEADGGDGSFVRESDAVTAS